MSDPRETAIRVVYALMRAGETMDREAYAERALRAHYDDAAAQAIIDNAPLEPWSRDAVPTARDIIAAALAAERQQALEDAIAACEDLDLPETHYHVRAIRALGRTT